MGRECPDALIYLLGVDDVDKNREFAAACLRKEVGRNNSMDEAR